MTAPPRPARALRGVARGEGGTATVEFVLLFPLFMTILLMGIESGFMLTRQVMMERAVDIAVRDLRLGAWAQPTQDDLRERICARGVALADCRANLLIELRRVSMTAWDFPAAPPACVDRTEEIAPLTSLVAGGGNDLMLLRACLVVDPLFPTTPWGLGLALDESGGFQLLALAAFVNEPR